ncbi:hypothetical protein EI94DRAFT_1833008 [Lactarius quietus]|nr:hypothetical protein EI94DRAFT_1833008 [Lactarius quietus]
MSTTASVTSSPPSTCLRDLLGKFSKLPHTEIILHSSDSHDFRVQKFYIVDSSPVLGKKITATTGHGIWLEATSETPCEVSTADGVTGDEPLLPIIQLPENHEIISDLLTFVFPVLPVLPPTIEQIFELLSVAEKYEMLTTLI